MHGISRTIKCAAKKLWSLRCCVLHIGTDWIELNLTDVGSHINCESYFFIVSLWMVDEVPSMDDDDDDLTFPYYYMLLSIYICFFPCFFFVELTARRLLFLVFIFLYCIHMESCFHYSILLFDSALFRIYFHFITVREFRLRKLHSNESLLI